MSHGWYLSRSRWSRPESYSKSELDTYASILERIAKEAYEDPELVVGSPYNSTIGKMADHSYLDDPKKWAITWREYRRKYRGYFEPVDRS